MGDAEAIENDSRKRRCRMAVSIALLGIGIVLLILVTVFYVVPKMITPDQFALVFDAGSTHTELTIFKWPPKIDSETAKIEQVYFSEENATCPVDGPGISSYADDPEGAGKSLEVCLEQAKNIIPPKSQAISNVFLGATAGMRLLEIISPDKSEAVMKSVKTTLSNSGFRFEENNAEITAGEDEGASAWISANLILEKFQKKEEMMGILDMGGASTQIAFSIKDWKPSPQLKLLRIFGVDYNVFSATFLCFGLSQFITRIRTYQIIKNIDDFNTTQEEYVINDPCIPKDFSETLSSKKLFDTGCGLKNDEKPNIKNLQAKFTFLGTSNPEECEKLIIKALEFNECQKYYDYCFDRSILPNITGEFKAVSSYYFAAKFYNFTQRANKPLRDIVIEECQKDWDKFGGDTLKDEHTKQFCVSGLYVNYILTEIYGFDTNEKWNKIAFEKKIRKVSLGWQLGYITNISNILPTEKIQGHFITANTYYILLAVSLIVILIAVVAVYIYCKSFKADTLPVTFSRNQNPGKPNETVGVRVS